MKENYKVEPGKPASPRGVSVYVCDFDGGFQLCYHAGLRGRRAHRPRVHWAAWVATKLTQPIRIGVTVVLTPIIGNIINRRKKAKSPE